MSEGPHAALATSCVSRTFERNLTLSGRPRQATALSSANVLLVGRNGSWGAAVLRSLEKFGSELSFAAPLGLTAACVRNGGFNLILLDSTVSPEQRKQMAIELAGSDVSIFYTFPVENGCWWLPALRRGENCHGAPAFRRNEFPAELERILSAPADA
jgi:hypothetical protein